MRKATSSSTTVSWRCRSPTELALSPTKAVAYKGNVNGCDVRAIITTMKSDQKDHQYAIMPESFAKYRRVVAEWMLDVCHYFNLHPSTTHAAVAYLDRLQPNETFSRYDWQMLAIACILLSSKYNEREEDVPPLRTLEEITQQAISKEDVLNFELLALKRMGWKLNARTPVAFVTSFHFAGILHAFDSWDSQMTRSELQAELLSDACMLCTVCLLDEKFKKHLASDLASAIVYWVRCKRGVCPSWRKELTDSTLCNPYSPGAIGAFAHLKELYPQERITLTGLPGSVSTAAPAAVSPVLRAAAKASGPETPVESPVRARDENDRVEITLKTPSYMRSMSAPSKMQTPTDQMIGAVSKGLANKLGDEDCHEPSPISIAINFD